MDLTELSSTISMQVVKISSNTYFDRSPLLKFTEAIQAVKLNQLYTKDEILEICAEVLSKDELETSYLFEANTYYQNILSNLNKERTDETKFILDFYSYLLKENDDISEDIKQIHTPSESINIDELLKNNKQYLPSLKQRMIDSELYEAIPLIDKYI